MRALIWKKGKEIITNKIKLAVSFILPVAALVWLIYNRNPLDNIFFLLPLISILVFWLIMFSIEDYIYTEAILGTSVTLKEVWISNLFLTVSVGFVYALLLNMVSLVLQNELALVFHFAFWENHLCALLIGSGLIAFSTFYISDYGKLRQLISSIGSVGSLIILVVLLLTDYKTYLLDNKLLFVIVLTILGFISFCIVDRFSNPEAFLRNIKKMGQIYEEKQTMDE